MGWPPASSFPKLSEVRCGNRSESSFKEKGISVQCVVGGAFWNRGDATIEDKGLADPFGIVGSCLI